MLEVYIGPTNLYNPTYSMDKVWFKDHNNTTLEHEIKIKHMK